MGWPGVTYLDDAGRELYRITIHDGLVYDSRGQLFDTSNGVSAFGPGNEGRAIFVMDEHGNLYASTYQEFQIFHHSSLLAGGEVADAAVDLLHAFRLAGDPRLRESLAGIFVGALLSMKLVRMGSVYERLDEFLLASVHCARKRVQERHGSAGINRAVARGSHGFDPALPSMRATVSGPAKTLVRPQSVPLDLHVAYLSGGGASGLPVKVRTLVEPWPLNFRDYPDYTFGGGAVP